MRPYTPTRSLRGRSVSFWWSSSEVLTVRFERWCRTRRFCGGPETNAVGVGAIVSSDWAFGRHTIRRPQHGLCRGQHRLRPYTELYHTYDVSRPDSRTHMFAL